MSSEPKIRIGGVVEAEPAGTEPITVEVERPAAGADGASTVQTFELHPGNRLNILGIFREIYFHHDPTFAFRNFECGRGICSTCNVMYEGHVQKGCRIPVPPGSVIRIGSQDPARSIRDIVCTVGNESDAEED